MRRRLTISLFAVLAVFAAARAEELRPPQDLERDALALEAKLDYDGAFDLYARALETLVFAERGRRSLEDAARESALAEVFVFKLQFLAERTGRWRDLGAVLERARAGGLPPLLDARCAVFLARARLAAGDIPGAEALCAKLGFLKSFAICGPFDNERGGGFETVCEPEKRIDFAARMRGKSREIGWTVPERHAFLGEVDLDAMLRPNDEALAYALAYIRWDGPPQAAAVRIGSDEGCKVFWNDHLVISRDVNRTLELDQDAAAVWLAHGWNKILLKVAERKGPWGFEVRLTELDGRPLQGFAEADEAVFRAGVKTPAWEEFETRGPEPGAVEALERLAKEGKATALDWFHLGYLRYRRKAHDEGEHPDREAFRRAVELEPKNAVYRVYLSHVSAETGEFSVNREENARRAELERALACDPGHARAALLLGEYYLRSLREPDRAETFVRRALEKAPDAVEARLLEVAIARARGWDGLARAKLEALGRTEAGRRSPIALCELADQAWRDGRPAEAERWARAALAIDFADRRARALLVEVRKAAGDIDGALALLSDRVRLDPFDVGARRERADLLAAAGRFGEAAKELDAALAVAPEDDSVIADLARIWRLAGEREKAVALFERALDLNPALVDARRYLQLLKEGERPFEDDYRLDPEEAIAAAAKVPIDRRVSARTLIENVVSKVNLDGTSSEFTEKVVRIENEDGIAEYDVVGVTYAAGEQRATVKRATVVKKDGRREEARFDNDSKESGGGEFATYAQRTIDFPPLEVGDIVIIEHRVDDLKQSFFGDYFGHTHFFQGFEPVERSRYTLVAPEGRRFFFHPRNLDIEPEKRIAPDGKHAVWIWEKRSLPRIEHEPDMPPFDEIAPSIQVSTFGDWNAFARWYWNLVRKQQEVSDEMRSKVDELVRDAKTREEKIRAIYNFVVTDVRYNDKWEFGVHGFKPYNAASIFTRRFGDCKDKATLICTMLSVAGIPAYPVLIDGQSRRGNEDYTLPLMSHFNHCIAYVPGPAPGGGEGWFLDGTAQDHEAENLPNMDRGATCLVVRPEGGELVRIGWPDPLAENGIRERWRVGLRREGGAEMDAEIEPGGVYSAVVRGQFTNEAERKEKLEKIYGRKFAGARVLENDFGDLKNLREPVKVRFRMRVPELLQREAGDFRLEEPRSVLFEWIYAQKMSELARKSERRWDVILPVPSGVEETAEVELPDGFSLKHVPKDARLETEFGTYEKGYAIEGSVLKITRRLVVKAQRVPVEKYARWREWAIAVDRADEGRAILGKGGLEE